MASLLRRIEARMTDPKLNANFNREVSKKSKVREEDIHNSTLVYESLQEYKKKDPNWMEHFE